MQDAVILSAVRTPVGAFQGSLSSITGPRLGSAAIKAAVERAGVSPETVDEVIMGEVLTAALGQAPARQAAIYAGLPNSVPAMTINKVCGSGMKAVMLAAQAIKLDDASIVVAGGMESMSNAPYALDKARSGYRMGNGTLIDTMVHDGLWDPYGDCHMGSCGDATATEFNVSREQLDAFAAESFRRASDAQQAGRFNDEIVPVEVPRRRGDPIVVSEDEGPGKGNPSKLATLRPAFGKEGVTTAGNASSINDGAAALVIAGSDVARDRGLKPLARIVAYTTYAHEPNWFTTAPAFAVQNLLDKTNFKTDDIDLFEINEAFSVVAMVVADKVGIPSEKLNVNGGAVALGHPIGATGARLIVTALHELHRRGGRYAICSPCIGGGEATAILIERL
jgi:acetyl-CoA C-acetyltransferase